MLLEQSGNGMVCPRLTRGLTQFSHRNKLEIASDFGAMLPRKQEGFVRKRKYLARLFTTCRVEQ